MDILDNYSRLNAIKTLQGINMKTTTSVSDYLAERKFEKYHIGILLKKLNVLIEDFNIDSSDIDIRYNLNICNTLKPDTLKDILRRLIQLKNKKRVILTIREEYG